MRSRNRRRARGEGRTVDMKFRVMLKDPDGIYECIEDAINLTVADVTDQEERAALKEVRGEKIRALTSRWFQFGDYCEVEIDTEAQTIRVVPVKETR
jgi:hypothetical protein